MFIGHFGAGFAGKNFSKSASLGTYFMAAQWVDLIWPILVLLGIEKVEIEPGISSVTPLDFTYYPFTHSLFGVLIWALLFGFVYFLIKKNSRVAIILGLLVLSHWVLDLFVHVPDLPIFPGLEIKVGLGLWNSLAATLIIEGLVFTVGLYLYLKSTTAKNKTGTYYALGISNFFSGNLYQQPFWSASSIR